MGGRHAAVLAVASAGLLLVLHGCGGSEFTSTPAVDSGAMAGDATSGDAAAPEAAAGEAAPAMCNLPPNGTGSEAAFCAFYAGISSQCGECEPCVQEDVNDCVTLGDTLSATFKSGMKTCQSSLGCGSVTSYASSPCVRAELAAVAPTQSQLDVKTAYCTGCPNNPNECSGFFDLTKDGGPAGLGAFALVASDAIDKLIVAQCSSAASPKCDALGYGVCVALVFCGMAPHGHCPKGLCD